MTTMASGDNLSQRRGLRIISHYVTREYGMSTHFVRKLETEINGRVGNQRSPASGPAKEMRLSRGADVNPPLSWSETPCATFPPAPLGP
jgi:hypothetical protein